MAKKAPTNDELLAQFDDLASPTGKPKKTPTSTSSAAAASKDDRITADLADLEALAKAKPASRPSTPRLPTKDRPSSNNAGGAARSSTEAGRKSGEGSITSGTATAGLTPTSDAEEALEKIAAGVEQAKQQAATGGGGWWGGIMATANAAMKQAETTLKDIQNNEEAQKWAEQVRGINVTSLKGLSDELRSRALPTFTNILNTIAPPISQHERLQIHITHDMIGYPSLDPTVYNIFSRVMAQVEGGDLLVIQRGSETRSASSSQSGWSDGPWWRDATLKRDLGVIQGLPEGTKLAKVNAEAFATEYYSPKGGVEEAIKLASQALSESNPTRTSDIFISIQAVGYENDKTLFGSSTDEENSTPEEKDSLIAFAIYLHDPVHRISFKTITQAFPNRWADWLDAENDPEAEMQFPEEIRNIVIEGGIDPREWVSEWVEEVVGLGIGIIAQKYVAKRMGVGETGVVGKIPAARLAVDDDAGEVARAF